MAIHVSPHDQVEFEDAYVRAAESIIKGRAAEKKLREFKENNPDGEALIKFVAEKAFTWVTDAEWYKAGNNIKNIEPRNFFDKIHLSIVEWGAPTQGQADAIRRIIDQEASKKAEWAARDALSTHIGDVGSKIEVEAVVYFQTGFSTQFGYTTITGFRAGDNIIIHKGTAPKVDSVKQDKTNSRYDWNTNKWVQVEFKREVEKGDRVILKATVKEHGERNGVKQTIVTRPKTKLVVEA
jgi:hypothetical protein